MTQFWNQWDDGNQDGPFTSLEVALETAQSDVATGLTIRIEILTFDTETEIWDGTGVEVK